MKKRVNIFLMLCCISFLSGCNFMIGYEKAFELPQDLSQKETVNLYFQYIEEKNAEGLLALLSERGKRYWSISDAEAFTAKIDSITLLSSLPDPDYEDVINVIFIPSYREDASIPNWNNHEETTIRFRLIQEEEVWHLDNTGEGNWITKEIEPIG